MVKEVKCFGGHIALVDNEDYPIISRHKWHIATGNEKGYACTKIDNTMKQNSSFYMHHLIMGMYGTIDHMDGNPLNNQKNNLRAATAQENGWNKGKPKGCRHGECTSKYKGVSKNKNTGFWHVTIKTTAKGVKPSHHIRIGPFKYEDDAARAYNKAIVELRGKWAWVNPLPEDELQSLKG